jgi:hypothetical protein
MVVMPDEKIIAVTLPRVPVEDSLIVPIRYDDMLACRDELIACARRRATITLEDLYDALHNTLSSPTTPGAPAIPSREVQEGNGDDWQTWLYAMLYAVGDECQKRGEPLLTALVTKQDGSVW